MPQFDSKLPQVFFSTVTRDRGPRVVVSSWVYEKAARAISIALLVPTIFHQNDILNRSNFPHNIRQSIQKKRILASRKYASHFLGFISFNLNFSWWISGKWNPPFFASVVVELTSFEVVQSFGTLAGGYHGDVVDPLKAHLGLDSGDLKIEMALSVIQYVELPLGDEKIFEINTETDVQLRVLPCSCTFYVSFMYHISRRFTLLQFFMLSIDLFFLASLDRRGSKLIKVPKNLI